MMNIHQMFPFWLWTKTLSYLILHKNLEIDLIHHCLVGKIACVLFTWWFWCFVEEFMQLFHTIIFLKSRALPLTFRSCKSWFNFFELYFWNFYYFRHQVIFINSNKCFSFRFVAIFCNYSRVLSQWFLMLIQNLL